MAFAAKDGKKFGNAQKQKAYDASKAAPKEESPKPDAEPKKESAPAETSNQEIGGGEDVSSQLIGEVVAAYGPAERIIIDVSPEGGASVETHHNGKVHKVELGSMSEADEHVKAATGEEAPPMMQEPMPNQDMGQGGGIPGM